MNLTIFCTAFIIQFVGHRIGDLFLQTEWQAFNKRTNKWARVKHCFVYTLTISILMLIAFDFKVFVIIFVLTLIEHYWIDSGKPIFWWLRFQEKIIARNKNYDVNKTQGFVVFEYDQTIHYMRIFILSILLAYLFR